MKNTMTILAARGDGAAARLDLADAWRSKKDKLLIWIGVNRDQAELQAIDEKFTADLGIPVTVEVVDPDLPQKFQQAAATGDGPDIVLWAHDRFGEWAQGGLIAPGRAAAGDEGRRPRKRLGRGDRSAARSGAIRSSSRPSR